LEGAGTGAAEVTCFPLSGRAAKRVSGELLRSTNFFQPGVNNNHEVFYLTQCRDRADPWQFHHLAGASCDRAGKKGT
jgi:hypothetical protein